MQRLLYTALYYALMPVIIFRLLLRSIKSPAYRRRMPERFGFFKPPQLKQPSIWIHAVSVGEATAAEPLIKALQARWPGHFVVVTTTTPTGSECVQRLYGDSVFHVYGPYDLPGSLRRFLKRVQPEFVVIMETELWPNLIDLCEKRGLPTFLVNGRLSEKSARGYERFSGLTKEMLNKLTQVSAQYQGDADRFMSLGLAPDKLQVTGSIKFDQQIGEATRLQAQRFSDRWRASGQRKGPVLLAASTHPGEEEVLLDAYDTFTEHSPGLLLVLVPRHPERFDVAYDLAKAKGFRVQRHSETGKDLNEDVQLETQVLVVDSMGIMPACFGASDLCFMGGSIVPHGGHNLMEPAAWGLAVVTGHFLRNFSEVSRQMFQAGGLVIVDTQEALSKELLRLLADEPARQALGEKALHFSEANRGVTEKIIELISRN
jgi:3-deoxy-D-manno-octulosonic-acid transferase